MEIKRVLSRKDGIKYVFVSKKSSIQKGDLVLIQKITAEDLNNTLSGNKEEAAKA